MKTYEFLHLLSGIFEGGEDVLGESIRDAQRRYVDDGNVAPEPESKP